MEMSLFYHKNVCLYLLVVKNFLMVYHSDTINKIAPFEPSVVPLLFEYELMVRTKGQIKR